MPNIDIKPRIDIHPLTPTIGAEISNIDLSQLLSQDSDQRIPGNAELKQQIHQAFLAHHVLFFREQQLTAAELVRFAELFGPVGAYPFAEPLADHPAVIAIIKEPEQKTVFGGIWHTDSTYLETPSLASVLYSIDVPAVGGDTLFANMHAAYDALDEPLQRKLIAMRAVNSSAKNQQQLRAGHLQSGAMQAKETDAQLATHPVVRRHPETGRPSLYLSPAHSSHFEGETPLQSEPLLQQLFEHATRDDYKCRFRWTPGTLAIWDNRCVLHYPINDYHGQRREMWRVTVDGEKPVGMH